MNIETIWLWIFQEKNINQLFWQFGKNAIDINLKIVKNRQKHTDSYRISKFEL